MGFELLHTSVPRGLKPGVRGFCTVAHTEGMPRPTQELCESLSGYLHLFAPHQPEFLTHSPVACTHYRFAPAGVPFSVLSRVACVGTDFTGWANTLAHHVVLHDQECSEAGPAWTLQQANFFCTKWSGEPRLIPKLKRIPAGVVSSYRADAWRMVTGDAGWAGWLAHKFLENPGTPVYIIYKPGMDMLPLVSEALRLIPVEYRWHVTFSTYFNGLPPGTHCAWRCCVMGAPTLQDAFRETGSTTFLDLTKPLPPLGNGDRLERCARSGTEPDWKLWAAEFAATTLTPAPPPEIARPQPADAAEVNMPAPAVSAESVYQPPPPTPGAASAAAPVATPELSADEHRVRMAAFLMVVFLALACALFLMYVQWHKSNQISVPAATADSALAGDDVVPATPLAVPAAPKSAVPTPKANAAAPVVPAPFFSGVTVCTSWTKSSKSGEPVAELLLSATTPDMTLTPGNMERSIALQLKDGCLVQGTSIGAVRPAAATGGAAITPVIFRIQDAEGKDGEVTVTLGNGLRLGGGMVRHVEALELVTASGKFYLYLLQPLQLSVKCMSSEAGKLHIAWPELPAWTRALPGLLEPGSLHAVTDGGRLRFTVGGWDASTGVLDFVADSATQALAIQMASQSAAYKEFLAMRERVLPGVNQKLQQRLVATPRDPAAVTRQFKRHGVRQLVSGALPVLFGEAGNANLQRDKLVAEFFRDGLDSCGLTPELSRQAQQALSKKQYLETLDILLAGDGCDRLLPRQPLRNLLALADTIALAAKPQHGRVQALAKLQAATPETLDAAYSDGMQQLRRLMLNTKLGTDAYVKGLNAQVAALVLIRPERAEHDFASMLAAAGDLHARLLAENERREAQFDDAMRGRGAIIQSGDQPVAVLPPPAPAPSAD